MICILSMYTCNPEEAPATPQRDSIQVNHPERRPSQGNKPASRRGQVQEYAGYQIMPVAVDRPRSTPDSYPQQQGYFEDTSLGPRRFSAANKTVESVSHMDLDAGLSVVSGERPEQWAGEYRVRTLDQAPAAQERRISSPSLSRQGPLVTYRGPSAMARAPPIQPTSGAEMQMSDQRALNSPTLKPNAGPTGVQDISGSYEGGVPTGPPYVRHNGGSLSEYREEARRGSGVGSRRDSGLESPVVYDSRGAAGPPRHQRDHPPAPPYPAEDSLRIAHAQPFTARTTPPETPYAYPSRQGYTGSNTQRSVDYGAPTHYPEDHHRSSVSSNPYDRSDYTTRPQVDAPSQHTVPFHPPAQLSQHSSYASREQQQPAPRSRPTSHHDLYSEYQQQAVPHSQPPSHAKYAAPNGTDLSHMFQEVEHSAVVKYPSGLASGDDPLPVHGRYASHGHPSYPSTAREEPAALRRESLVTSPPRPQDYRSQSIPQFASTGSGSAPPKTYPHSSGENIPTGGYDSFHQERESDNGSRYPNHGSSGFPAHSDSSPPSAVGPESNGQYNRGGNPTTVPYSTHHQEPVSGMVHGEVLRQAPIEYGHEHRPPYGHGRTMSSLSIHRPSYTPTSAPMPAGHPLGSGMRASNPSVSAAGPTQGRGAGRYDGYESSQGSAHGPHYTTAHPVNHGSAPDPYGAYVGGGGGGGGGGGRTSEHVYEHSAGHVPQPPPPHYPHSQQQQPPPQQPPPPPMQQVQHPHQHQHPQYHTPVPPPHHQYQHYPEPPPLNHGPPPPSQHQHQAHPHAQTHIHAHVRAQGHVLGPAQIQAAQQHGHSHAPLYPMQPQAGGPHGYGYGPSTVTHGEEAGRSRS
ncbi:hypothetical protein EDD21DRAFT_145817 [Dissophora ornata]|nr:hypothetical protein EDD21DRAFT_145817 [Dissophora ornata]